MDELVPASADLGLPAIYAPALTSRLSSRQDGFNQAVAIALAQAALLARAAVVEAHSAIVAQYGPNAYSVAETAPFLQSGNAIPTRIAYFYMDDIAQFTLQTLRDRSPVGSGRDRHPGLYRDSHLLFIDGHNVPDAKNWRPGQALEFSNPEPYARKIEIGAMKISVPPHVYQETAPIVAAKYGNSVNVQFTFMPLRFGSIDAYAQSATGRADRHRKGTIKSRRDWLARQPAILITAR